MSKIEAKEFWIAQEYELATGVYSSEKEALDNAWMSSKENVTHVIEYSAYQKLKEKLDKAIEQRNTYIRAYNRITAETIIQELDKE